MKGQRVSRVSDPDTIYEDLCAKIGHALIIRIAGAAVLGHRSIRSSIETYNHPEMTTTAEEIVLRVLTGEPPGEIVKEWPWIGRVGSMVVEAIIEKGDS